MLSFVVARQSGEVLRAADLEVHPTEFLAYANGRVVMLTQKEQQLLAAMMRNDGHIMSRDELYALVWGRKMKPGDRTVDVFVRKLRVRLEEALPGWKFIHTHFGFGYRFEAERLAGKNGSFTTR
jgi:DNA-binding response OmpR family regulator